MLRNLNQSSSGRRICGDHRVGILASEIPTGFALPSLLANDVDGEDPAGTQYRVKILTIPAGLTFKVYEDGSYEASAADGSYTGDQQVYKTGVAQAPTTYTINIGSAASQVSSDLAGSYSVRAPISADRAGAYTVRSPVSADRSGAYGVRAKVSSDRSGSYSVLSEGGQGQNIEVSAPRTVNFLAEGPRSVTFEGGLTAVTFVNNSTRVTFEGNKTRVDFVSYSNTVEF